MLNQKIWQGLVILQELSCLIHLWNLLSYYSQPVLNIRPPEANAMLPTNNPRLSDQKLGAAVFQEIQILRFLGDNAAVSRHEAILQWITDRGNVTRTQIETFYRNNVRTLISEVVDAEFRGVTVPATISAEIKKAIGDFYVLTSRETLSVLATRYYAFNQRFQITRLYNNANVFEEAGFPDLARESRNSLNLIIREFRNITGEDFNPSINRDYDNIDYSRNYLNILKSLSNDLWEYVRR